MTFFNMKKSILISMVFLFSTNLNAASTETIDTGTIPNISDHYQAVPVTYPFEKMPIEKMDNNISRQYLYGAETQIVKWYFKKGADVPLHHHLSEQITWIVSGKVKVYSQNKVFEVKAGEVIIIPANVPHHFVALEDTIDIDFFAPARQDWIDNTASYIKPHT